MGLIEAEIKELRDLRRLYRSGKIDERHVATEVSIFSQTEKRARLLLDVFRLGIVNTENKKFLASIQASNLAGVLEAIDIGGDPELEKVKCPEFNKLITRQECLDYSGINHDLCDGCEAGKATKKILLPEM